ncbi:FAD-binding domain-containing protein [Dendrothele bispora CBS 962.96]|uniref:FAD-binding domain-containing protein n=1 Tax=Dendrothele bispora (strain CBS 962.96) TaxID=1314807 RepID=A0A4S8KXH0_DENBC|nr:FAD-binding domain-containing protein [Dendrothele bispora CBS 962.96]
MTSQNNDIYQEIANAVSDETELFRPDTQQYEEAIRHWGKSSSEYALFSVEPGTAEDLAAILCILAAKRVQWAVKSGGHATNRGFSSTSGVQIFMNRFKQITLNKDANKDVKTVTVGTGLTWDEIYDELTPQNLNVVGGRVPGVGVGGLLLGGGYSWLTSQYGLAIDNVKQFEVVLPNGQIKTVTEADNDLWFGLRGGLNNFGIVTVVTLATYPQGQIWGGIKYVDGQDFDALTAAVTNFAQNNQDRRASILPVYSILRAPWETRQGAMLANLMLFYDGAELPAGVFQEFMDLKEVPVLPTDLKTRTFANFVSSIPANNWLQGDRVAFHSLLVPEIRREHVQEIQNIITVRIAALGGRWPFQFTALEVQPFDASLYTYGADSAFPPKRDSPLYPIGIYWSWKDSAEDQYAWDTVRRVADRLRNILPGDESVYVNYALADTPLEAMYGDNVERLHDIRVQYDSSNLMSLTGGFRF